MYGILYINIVKSQNKLTPELRQQPTKQRQLTGIKKQLTTKQLTGI